MNKDDFEIAEKFLSSLKLDFKITEVRMDHDIRAFGPKTTISGIAIFPGGSGNFSFEFNGIGIPINGNALPEPKEKKDE